MTGLVRSLLGAALGSILALLIHPASRPYIDAVFTGPLQPESIPQDLATAGISPKLGTPRDLVEAGLWMQAAGVRTFRQKPLSTAELESLLRIAQGCAAQEPENAFWKQMAAVFLYELGRADESRQAWMRASRALTWRDYQTERLMEIHRRITRHIGTEQAWPLGALYYSKSDVAAQMVGQLARRLIEDAGFREKQHLELRMATLRNGNSMRQGSKALDIMTVGAEIMELASHPSRLPSDGSRKRLYLARLELQRTLRENGMDDEAAEASRSYLENDAWLALTQAAHEDSEAEALSRLSVLLAVLPSAALASSCVGILLMGIGRILQIGAVSKRLVHSPVVLGLGGFLGVGVYFLTLLPLAGLAVALCFGFVAFSPRHDRARAPDQLGPLFKLSIGIITCALLGVSLSYFAGLSLPARTVLPLTGWPQEVLDGGPLYISLSLIIIGLMFLISPLWAFANRVRTSDVLSLALMRCGKHLALAGLFVGVVAGPTSVYADRAVRNTLQKLVENEPVYYLTR